MTFTIMTREEARAQGLPTFFTGHPCAKGHLSLRRVGKGRAQPCVECQAEYHRAWYAKNLESKRAANRKIARSTCPEIIRARSLAWRNRNLDRARANARAWYSEPANNAAHHNIRDKRLKVGGSRPSAKAIRGLLTAQSHRCAYCRANLKRLPKHLDHILPLSRGGGNDITNLQWLCAPCNLSKGAKDPIAFAQERGLLL